MYLIETLIEGENIEHPKNLLVLSQGRMGLHLRNGLSLASRVTNISLGNLPVLEKECSQYFNLASLFHSVSLSIWVMGYCVPFHTRELLQDLGVGLGINSMQGREAKHQHLLHFQAFPW